MEHYDIFISYKRNSLPTANNLYNRLTTRGYSAFYDKEEMGRGNFDVQLLNYIENAKDVFAILEEGSLDGCKQKNWEENDWFLREVAFALEKKKNIIPILIGHYEMPSKEFFPDKLKELSLKQAPPDFSFTFFEEYLDKLIEKRFLLSKPNLPIKIVKLSDVVVCYSQGDDAKQAATSLYKWLNDIQGYSVYLQGASGTKEESKDTKEIERLIQESKDCILVIGSHAFDAFPDSPDGFGMAFLTAMERSEKDENFNIVSLILPDVIWPQDLPKDYMNYLAIVQMGRRVTLASGYDLLLKGEDIKHKMNSKPNKNSELNKLKTIDLNSTAYRNRTSEDFAIPILLKLAAQHFELFNDYR